MTPNGWLQIFLYFAVILLMTKPMGVFMAKVFSREHTFLDPVMRPVERLLYKLTRVDENHEMRWTEYSIAMLLFSAVSMLVLYLLERAQQALPFNPQKLAAVPADLAWNTAASFTTNTNWQFYTGEQTMSYLTQMAGLAFHNFASAAVGIALAVAFIRGIARREKETIGNFWVDTTRSTLWVLLPICIVYSLVLVSQGVIQNFKPYDTVKIVEPQQVQKVGQDGKPVVAPNGKPVMDTITDQVIAQGPVASQEAIKMLGTNGGGFMNSNSAHPFENPTPFSNFLEMLSIFVIPAGLTYTLGRMTGSQRHGWAVFAAMAVLFFAGVTTAYRAESQGNPLLTGTDQRASTLQSGGNMEGKEVRFGIANSALFATVTTDASCGAVNGMHDSYTPLGGLVPLVNIMLGEIVFGGVGAGMYGILIFVVLSVFIAGLMVGRTPEYLGKKIEAYDVKMAMLYVLIFPVDDPCSGCCFCAPSSRTCDPYQHRATRAFRNSLRVYFRNGQQRFRVCRSWWEPLVQPGYGIHHVDWAFSHDRAHAGGCWQPGPKEGGSALTRHISGDNTFIHCPSREHNHHRWSFNIFPGVEPGTNS